MKNPCPALTFSRGLGGFDGAAVEEDESKDGAVEEDEPSEVAAPGGTSEEPEVGFLAGRDRLCLMNEACATVPPSMCVFWARRFAFLVFLYVGSRSRYRTGLLGRLGHQFVVAVVVNFHVRFRGYTQVYVVLRGFLEVRRWSEHELMRIWWCQ